MDRMSRGSAGGSRLSSSTLFGAKSFQSPPTPSPSSLVGRRAAQTVSAAAPKGGGGGGVGGSGDGGSDWDGALGMLKAYGVPLATVALCGAGAFYFSKRLADVENKVTASRRNDVRHLSETDVRMIAHSKCQKMG